MGRKKVEGGCRLCEQQGPLSYEHVPPRAAFNDQLVVRAHMDQWRSDLSTWDGRNGEHMQGGAGAYTLCGRCNNTTGSWYAKEYVALARRAFEFLSQVPEDAPPFTVLMPRIYPLRFLKQAVTMFFSVNRPEFASHHRELQRFVLNRDERHLPNRYEIYLTLVRGGFARSSGASTRSDLGTGEVEVLSEVAHIPFALTLTIDSPRRDDLGRISHFGESRYDDQRDVRVRLRAGEIRSMYPDDYRTKAQLERDRAASDAR